MSSSQVRALVSPTDKLILSASRDTTAISWRRSPADSQFKPDIVLKAGSRYINSVAFIPPGPDSSKGMCYRYKIFHRSLKFQRLCCNWRSRCCGQRFQP